MPESPRAIIFTALKVETEAVMAHLEEIEGARWAGDVHRRGKFPGGIGWDVLVVQTGAENQNAALETQAALLNFEPAVAIFVGVAGGFEEEGIKEFDLVVPPRIDYYQAGKAGRSLTLRPRQQNPTQYMIGAAREIARTGSWQRLLQPPPKSPSTVHLEPLASGDHVVKSLDSWTYKLIRTNLDQAIAVDMESSGFLLAASLRRGVESAVVRGVSDLLSDKDRERDASRQPEAARRAAAFAFELLATAPPDVLDIHDLPVEPKVWGSEAKWDEGMPEAVADERSHDDDLGALAVDLGEKLAKILDVDHWQQRTENFFGNPPVISAEFDERLQNALAWTEARVPIPGLDGVLDAIANVGAVLRDFRDVFHDEIEPSPDGRFLRVKQFYRQYDKPLSERERLVAEYEKHNLLIKDLAAEMTRAINLVGDRVRDLAPRYRIAQGAVGIFAGADESFIVVAYKDEERELPRPYPGLSKFQQVLSSRDGSFGPYRNRNQWPEEILDELKAALAESDLPAAHRAAFEFAALVADVVPPRDPIRVTGGPRGSHTVQFRPVTVRWRSPDGLRRDDPVRHLARTFVTRRGEVDVRKERLVGAPDDDAVGEVLDADGSIVLEPLRDSDLPPFAVEAGRILKKLEQ